jgi:hypothetical protein
MLVGKNGSFYIDDKNKKPTVNQTKILGNGEFTVVIQPKGGFVITDH